MLIQLKEQAGPFCNNKTTKKQLFYLWTLKIEFNIYFSLSPNISFLQMFFWSFNNAQVILSSWAAQNQVLARTWSLGSGCPCVLVLSHSVMSDSLWHRGLYPPGFSVDGIFQAKIQESSGEPGGIPGGKIHECGKSLYIWVPSELLPQSCTPWVPSDSPVTVQVFLPCFWCPRRFLLMDICLSKLWFFVFCLSIPPLWVAGKSFPVTSCFKHI